MGSLREHWLRTIGLLVVMLTSMSPRAYAVSASSDERWEARRFVAAALEGVAAKTSAASGLEVVDDQVEPQERQA